MGKPLLQLFQALSGCKLLYTIRSCHLRGAFQGRPSMDGSTLKSEWTLTIVLGRYLKVYLVKGSSSEQGASVQLRDIEQSRHKKQQALTPSTAAGSLHVFEASPNKNQANFFSSLGK